MTPTVAYVRVSLDRPALARALARLRAGKAAALLVVKLDRLTRSVRDLGELVDRCTREGWPPVDAPPPRATVCRMSDDGPVETPPAPPETPDGLDALPFLEMP